MLRKPKYVFVSRQKNTGQNNNIKTGMKCFENVAKFKCLETAPPNQNCVRGNGKMGLTLRFMCCQSVWTFFFLPFAV